MKSKLILLIPAALLSISSVFAQPDAIEKYFSQYTEDPAFTQVNITGTLFSLLGHIQTDDPEDQEILDAMAKIDGFHLVTREDLPQAKSLYEKALKRPGKEFESLMSVQDGDESMHFMVREVDGTVQELLMVFAGDDELMILTIFGEIDLDTIARISKKVEIDGFEHLDKIEDRKR